MIVDSGRYFFPALIASGGGSLAYTAHVGLSDDPTTADMIDLVNEITSATVSIVSAGAGDSNYDLFTAVAQHGPGGTFSAKEIGFKINDIMIQRYIVDYDKMEGEYVKTTFTLKCVQSDSDGFMPTVGREFLSRYLAADGGAITVSVKVGTGTTAPALTDTDLETPVDTDSSPTVTSDDDALKLTATLGPSGTFTLHEYGYFLQAETPGTALKQRWVTPSIVKNDGDYVTIYMTDQFLLST